MDFISRLLEKRIKFYESENNVIHQKVYVQARFEYTLIYLLGYLWNKNFDKLDTSTKEHIAALICRPSIGDIVSISRSLDIEKEVFKSKLFNTSVNK